MKLKGSHGWAIIAIAVVLIDIFAEDGETLSEATYRARQSHPELTYFAIGATVYHFLFGDHTRLSVCDVYKIPARLLRQTRKLILK